MNRASNVFNGAEAFLHTLAMQEVDYIFCSPIGACGPVWEALARREEEGRPAKPRYLNCRHELLAVGLAAGYYKATGRAQVCLLPTGFGVLNGSLALHDALQERTAITVVTPDTQTYGTVPKADPGAEWPYLLTDLTGPARDAEVVTKWSHEVRSPHDLVSNLQRALYFAESIPRGPTHLSVPLDVFMAEIPTRIERKLETCPLVAPSATLSEAAVLLAKSREPIILTEHIGRTTAQADTLVAIAERLGAPVFEPFIPAFHNFPRNHALHAQGFVDAETLGRADCILVAGSNGPWHPPNLSLNDACRVIVMEEDPLRPRAPFWGYQTDLCIAGDLGMNLSALRDALEQAIDTPDEARIARWTKFNNERKRVALAQAAKEAKAGDAIHPAELFSALAEVLPERSTIVDEIIIQAPIMNDVLFQKKRFSQVRGFGGALGQGMAQALGIKLAKPEEFVVCIIGDGAFNYSPVLACFGLAQQYGVPILVIICNNHGYNSQKWLTQGAFPDGVAVRNDNIVGAVIDPEVDYAGLAAPFGAYGKRITATDDLEAGLREAMAAIEGGRLALLDVHVQP